MALIRGYSRVDEDGTIAIPTHIQRYTQLTPGSVVEYRVMRVKETARRFRLLAGRVEHEVHIG